MYQDNKFCFMVTAILMTADCESSYYSEPFIKNLYDSLHSHEKTIMKIFQEPKLVDGPKLMEALESYNENLAQLVSIIREDNSTFAPARKICDDGGPQFLKIKHDDDNLQKTFNWTESFLKEMYYLKGATEVLWWDLTQLDPKGTHYPIIHNFTKDEIDFLYDMDKENRLNELIEFTKINDFERTDKPHKQLEK